MELGAQILQQLQGLEREAGSSSARLEALRAEFERSRNESSDRHKALCAKLEGLSELSQARHEDVGRLRELVERCPQHAGHDIPESRIRKTSESGEMRRARRGVLKALAALFGAAATAVGGWWAAHSGAK